MGFGSETKQQGHLGSHEDHCIVARLDWGVDPSASIFCHPSVPPRMENVGSMLLNEDEFELGSGAVAPETRPGASPLPANVSKQWRFAAAQPMALRRRRRIVQVLISAHLPSLHVAFLSSGGNAGVCSRTTFQLHVLEALHKAVCG